MVTGAGSGIGRAVSVALFQAGYRVVLAGRHERNLLETLAGHESSGLVVATDVTQEMAVIRRSPSRWIDQARTAHGVAPRGRCRPLYDES